MPFDYSPSITVIINIIITITIKEVLGQCIAIIFFNSRSLLLLSAEAIYQADRTY